MLIDNLKMPNVLLTLGFFYSILIIIILLKSVVDGIWSGILTRFIAILYHNKTKVLMFLFIILFIIVFFDKNITNWCRLYYNYYIYTILDFFSSMGEGWFIVGLSITVMLIANVLGIRDISKIFEMSANVAVFSGLFNLIFKLIFNRERPSAIGSDPSHFFYFILSKDYKLINLTYAYNSMPSGHTITIASSLMVIFLAFKNQLIRWICLFFMIIIPMSRLYTLNHWFSDVIVSFVIGLILGYIIYDIYLSNKDNII